MTAELFAIRQPARAMRFINKGISGNTVADLQERWTDDALEQKPDILVLLIGINDLHRTLAQAPTAVPPERFAALYKDILDRTVKALPACKIVLLDPFYMTRDAASTSNRARVLARLPAYIRVVHAMARQYRTRLIRTHDLFQKLLRTQKAEQFCGEPVHPQHTGHLAMAEAVYAVLANL